MRGKELLTVPFIDNMFSGRLANLQSALDRTTQRHGLIADNLANVNTPGFKRKDVDFNIILDAQMNPGKARMQQMRDQQIQQASDQTSLRLDGNNVDMEREVMSMSETELRYETLTQLTTGYFSDLKSAIHEGK